jgi:hypothetical protein
MRPLVECEWHDDEDDDTIVENFQQLERLVVEGLDSGELSPEDPIVKKYFEAVRRARGSAGRGFVGDAELNSRARTDADDWVPPDDEHIAELERSSAARSESAEEDDPGAQGETKPDRPQPDDPFAVEEGDPFTDDDW